MLGLDFGITESSPADIFANFPQNLFIAGLRRHGWCRHRDGWVPLLGRRHGACEAGVASLERKKGCEGFRTLTLLLYAMFRMTYAGHGGACSASGFS